MHSPEEKFESLLFSVFSIFFSHSKTPLFDHNYVFFFISVYVDLTGLIDTLMGSFWPYIKNFGRLCLNCLTLNKLRCKKLARSFLLYLTLLYRFKMNFTYSNFTNFVGCDNCFVLDLLRQVLHFILPQAPLMGCNQLI